MLKSMFRADSIARSCIVALIALLPFFIIPFPWASVVQAKTLLVALLVSVCSVAWLWGQYQRQLVTIPKHLILVAAFALPAVYVLSALAAGSPPGSYVSGSGEQGTVAGIYVLFMTLALSAVVFGNARDGMATPLKALISGGAILLVAQIVHLFLPSVTFGVLPGSAASLFGSWHDLGTILSLFVLFAAILWRSPVAEGWWKWLFMLVGTASFLFLFVINMRDIWYMLGAFGAVSLLMLAVHARIFHRESVLSLLRERWYLVAVVVVSVAAGLASTFIFRVMPPTLRVAQLEVRPSWQGTLAVGHKVLTGATTAVFGSGPNTFTRKWSAFKPASINTTDFWNVDFNAGVGFIPTTFVTVGALGVLAWTLLFAALLFGAWRFVHERKDFQRWITQAALYVAALYLFIFHLMYVPTVAVSMLMFVIPGLIVAVEAERTGVFVVRLERNLWGSVRTFGFVVAVGFLILGSAGTVRAVISDMYVNNAVVAYARSGNTGPSLASIQTALLVRPDNDRAHRAAVELGLIQLRQVAAEGKSDSASVTALRATLQDTIKHGLSAVSIDTADYQNWLSLAGLYKELGSVGVQGSYDNAKEAYRKAAADAPTNPLPYIHLAQLGIAENDLAGAREHLDKAIALKPNFAAAFYLRSQIEARENHLDAAAADALRAAQYAREDPLAWYNLGAILYAQAKYADAIQVLQNAIALQKDYANALFLMGVSHDRLGQYAEALAFLERVQTLNPTDESLKAAIAEVKLKLSKAPQANR